MNNPKINQGNAVYYRNAPDNALDAEKIIRKVLSNWYWFAIALLIALAAAYLHNRYTVPLYEVRSTMLISEDKTNSPLAALYGSREGKFEGMQLMNNRENIYNQMAILGSTPIIARTLDELDFSVSYYRLGKGKDTEIYKDVPFLIIRDESLPQLVETDYYLTIGPDKKITVRTEGENVVVYDYYQGSIVKTIPRFSYEKEIVSGSKLAGDELPFTVLLNDRFDPGVPDRYKFRFHTPESLVAKYKSMLKVTLPDDYSSILHLTVQDFNVNRGIDFLNKLTEVYQFDNLDRKNENATRTIHFINAQLETISDSLSISENRLETFQSSNKMIDISTQSQQMLTELSELDKELAKRETQNKYYNYLKDYIIGAKEMETVIAPSAMGIEDPLLNSFIVRLNELITEKSSKTSIRQGSGHPTIIRLDAQIENVKRSLLESIDNIIIQSDMEIANLNERIGRYNYRIRRLPATERNFVNFERRYNIDSETYTFLLQKLSEAQIAKASSVPDSQVIEEPKMSALVKPQSRRTYAIGLMLGLIFPAAIIFLLDLFNNKITSEDDLDSITNFPVIGNVFHELSAKGRSTVVLDRPGSPASDLFRTVRSKLNLMTRGNEHPVIAVLSASPKEGKTYNVINIASSFALVPKRVVILDLDLRNSSMKTEFDVQSDSGVVDFITGSADIEKIVFKTKHPGLDVIPSGKVPPNPAEMLLDRKISELVARLKEIYDVIVVDTSPVGSVTDMLPLSEIIDATVFVVRNKFTVRKRLKEALAEVENYQMKEPGIVFFNMGKVKIGYGYY
jgi:capsular exopolysaccharide synthesis family protein